MATDSPIVLALPEGRALAGDGDGFEPVDLHKPPYFRP